jgi:hypothetical protein
MPVGSSRIKPRTDLRVLTKVQSTKYTKKTTQMTSSTNRTAIPARSNSFSWGRFVFRGDARTEEPRTAYSILPYRMSNRI